MENTAEDYDNHRVDAEQVNQLYSLEPVGLIATFINSAILIFIQWRVISHTVLITWFSCLILITAVRYLMLHRYRHAAVDPEESQRWAIVFVAGAVLSGLGWGLGGILLFPEHSIPHQVFLLFVLGGMVAGAAAAYSVHMPTFIGYSIPALVPVIVRLLTIGDEIHLAMGAMALLFAVLMLVTATRVNAMTLASLRLRFENSSLIQYLAEAKERAEAVNVELNSEIRERESAEAELRRHREHLESMVAERTAELLKTNQELQREINERKRVEGQLRENEKRYRELTDLLPLAVFEIDAEGNFNFVNRAAYDAFGYTPSDLDAGVNVAAILIPEDREKARHNIQRKLQGADVPNAEYTALRKDGSRFPVVVYSSRIVRGETPVGLRGVLVDITERKSMEAELLKAQKLESVGVLAGGIAHDFNNILTAILGNLSLARMFTKPGEELTKRLEETEKASLRARDLTQQLLTFSRGGAPVKKNVLIKSLIEDSVSFALRGSNVRCEFSLPNDLWHAEVDEAQIGQVIHNLIRNAVQAMPNGGIVKIDAANTILEASGVLPLRHGKYLKIQIEDQGCGIPQEDLPKIFDPYFTTKEKGNGLGLATAYSIIKKHEGHIAVQSDVDSGAIFSIYLPAFEVEIRQREGLRPSRALGEGKILVMDDEELVRDVLGEMLKQLGYEAAFARDGEEAIEIYRNALESNEPFDAAILDLTIPGGMGGKEAIRRLSRLDPGIRAIVSSGYSDDPTMAEFGKHGFSACIPKPYTIDSLSGTLRNVLKANAGAPASS